MEPSTDCVSPSTSKTEDTSYVDSEPNPRGKPKKPNSGEKSKKHNSEEKSKRHHSEEKPKKHHSEEKPKKHHSEEKSRKTNSEIKKSVKALLKALVLDDKSKRSSHHQRSSTYPVQSNSLESESFRHLESSDENSSNEDHTRVFNQTGGASPAIGSLNPLFLMSEESSCSDNDECKVDVDENGSDVKERDSKKKKKKKKRDKKAWYDPKLIHDEELVENDDASPRRSKACLDALNLIHMNRNFLLKVLQGPDSPLARHFNSQHTSSARTVLTKAGSFPVPSSPGKRDSQPKDHNVLLAKSNGNERDSSDGVDKKFPAPSIAVEYRADGIQKLNDTIAKFAAEDSSGPGYTSKRGKNQVVVKRFKDLRQKIRHVINEHKNEKHRITMDAVLDKVPRKYGFSKDLRQDVFYQLKGPSVDRNQKGDSKLKQIRRTSSLGGSLDRYLQLYECSFQREGKSQISEKSQPEAEESVLPSRVAPKILGRILSLPEMKCYSFKLEESSEKQVGEFATARTSDELGQDDLVSIDQLDTAIESEASEDTVDATERKLELAAASDSEEEKVETEIDDELMLDTELQHDHCKETTTKSSDESSEDSPCLECSFSFDEDAPEVSISQEIDAETEKQLERVANDEDVEVEAEDRADFNYVRDILEISGFRTKESLSTWNSDYQPLDPLVYEEVTTGCMLEDPECWGNEEGGNCYHLLLFDLINEVLIEIYERSYYYSPMPLSSLCRIHPMPAGYSVLKDVWIRISGYLRWKPIEGQPLDQLVSRDLSKSDGWMNLQFDSECVGLEVEDLIFDQLLEEFLVMD
ncbi:PREDICTED: uncharacterized protein LOC104816274 isoform X2 [Tarenaya hassleriana]|nr:PREDICTED: uncharacterized protein LOC104816274 isoform X2 [Tarenaya hassleriana]